jgi:hypothetical protein
MMLILDWIDLKFPSFFFFSELISFKSSDESIEFLFFGCVKFCKCSVYKSFIFSSKTTFFSWDVRFEEEMNNSLIFRFDDSEFFFLLKIESYSLLYWIFFGSNLSDLLVSDAILEGLSL